MLGEVGGGVQVLQSVIHRNKYMLAGAVVGYLKDLLNETITHTNTRHQFGQPLSEFSLVRQQLAKMSAKLYCLESMVYLTAGLADASKDADIEVESVIVKQFAAEVSELIVSGCLGLLGSQVTLDTSKYQKYLRESLMLQGWQGTANINKCFVGISGLQHLAKHKPELARVRQPADGNLLASVKHSYDNWGKKGDKIKYIYNLSTCVHPGLLPATQRMEWSAIKAYYVAQETLTLHGGNVHVAEQYLERLSDIMTEVYSMVCATARASRSATLGHDNSDLEFNTVIPLSLESK